MGLLDRFKKGRKNKESGKAVTPYLYNGEEIDVVDSFISDMFGSYNHVFHEIASPDIHLDVYLILGIVF